MQALEGQRLATGGRCIAQAHLPGRDAAGQPHHGLWRLLKRHLDVGIQHAALQPDRQAGRPVRQVGAQVQATQRDLRVGLARLGKGRALGGRVKAAAVELEGQMRRRLDVALGSKVAQKGHGKIELAQLVRLAHGLVHIVKPATAEHEVVERKLRRFASRLVGSWLEPLEHVINVVAPRAPVRQGQRRFFDDDGVCHRRQPQQRLHLGIYIDALDVELGGRLGCTGCIGLLSLVSLAWRRAVRLRFGDGQVMQRQLQRPGLEVHRTHCDLAAQLVGGDFLQLPLQQRRHGRIGQRPQQQQAANRQGDAALPARRVQCNAELAGN